MTATAQYPDHLSAIERPIIDRIIREALHTRGYQIEVWGEDNDGEPDCPLTSDYSKITAEVAATDGTILKFFHTDKISVARPTGYVGMMLFIHGNEEDVLSDLSDNAAMEELDNLAVVSEPQPKDAPSPLTIDVTPTWAGIMPGLIAVLEDGTQAGKDAARAELMRLAHAVDASNAAAKR